MHTYATLAKTQQLWRKKSRRSLPGRWGARTRQPSGLAKAAALLRRLGRHDAANAAPKLPPATRSDREEDGVVDC